MGLFFGISLSIFIIALLWAGGLYAYRSITETRVSQMKAHLEKAKGAFDPQTITDLKRLNARISAAEKILASHLAVSSFFSEIEAQTLKTVRFNEFSYSQTEQGVEVRMRGSAKNYTSVALQSDIFGKSKYIRNPIFANLGINTIGNVTFDVTMLLDPSLVLYKESLK